MSFRSLGLVYPNLKTLEKQKLHVPTPIQEKKVQFNIPNKIPLERVEDSEISAKDDVKILKSDVVTKLQNSENLYIHSQNIKTREAVLGGRVMSISHPVSELRQIDLTTVMLNVTSIETMKRVE